MIQASLQALVSEFAQNAGIYTKDLNIFRVSMIQASLQALVSEINQNTEFYTKGFKHF